MLAATVRIQLCGALAVEVDGRRIEHDLPGRQGRLLFAFLILHRLRPIRRDELIEALWPRTPPAAADVALRALLSKLRRVLPDGALDGRAELRLHLPPGAFVDVEHAREAIHGAESAVAQGDWYRAWSASMTPMFTARRGFLPDEDADWIRNTRHELDALYLRSLECYSQACLGVGGTELAGAERSARELTRRAPYHESGYRHLMRALAARGNSAEALRAYEELRTRLREELGIAPCAATLALHAELLATRAPATG
jgi:SARP family transcriptional regulator, regulator of embCAB operon